jgi:hypothetical protein
MPGGDAEVVLDGEGVTLVGPSVRIAAVEVDPTGLGIADAEGSGS